MTADRAWHSAFIEQLAELLRPQLYIEVGVGSGATFERVAPRARRAIGVDPDAGAGVSVRQAGAEFLQLRSVQAAELLMGRGERIDLLFIDADHSAESLVEDFTVWEPLLRPHGLMLLHDTHPGSVEETHPALSGDCYRSISLLEGLYWGRFEMVTLPVAPGLTICRKRRKQLAWQEDPDG